MIENFQYEKEIFGGLPHNIIQFSFSFQDNTFKGHYKDGEINWFHPKPERLVEDTLPHEIEEEVLKKIEQELGIFILMDNFQVERIFEGLPHEVIEFSFNMDDRTFKGHFKDGEISWFDPKPSHHTEEILSDEVEAAVLKKLGPYLS
ncbi:hypothetical protein [Psychrobacillus soli]|uniref:Uncharacterized protein n=1 Tax=Psychrobacillus soli TaxID=1543965 RepID=A0A544TMW9_9BACI|nr:hypothetical protein [Psychrobacillus soli]TQR18804.1 hypothetical protein FG383_00525 [Psychrobacillus soli]